MREGVTMAPALASVAERSAGKDEANGQVRGPPAGEPAAMTNRQLSGVGDGVLQVSSGLERGPPTVKAAMPSAVELSNSEEGGNSPNLGAMDHIVKGGKTSVPQHGDMLNKKRRINENQQKRRIRATTFESQNVRNVDAELYNTAVGFQPRDQGILGGGPALQVRDRGILEGGPAAQLKEQGMVAGWPAYQLRERGILEGGHAPLMREQGMPPQWFASQLREQGILPGLPGPQVREKGLLGRGPSSVHVGAEGMLRGQAHSHGTTVDQEPYYNNTLGGSLPREHGILGGGPIPQLREQGILTASQFRDQGLLGRWPISPPNVSEGTQTLQARHNERFTDQDLYRNVGAPELTFRAHKNRRYVDQEQYKSVGAPELPLQAHMTGRYVEQEQYTSAGAPEVTFQETRSNGRYVVGASEVNFHAHNNGRFVDHEQYKSVCASELAFQAHKNGRYVNQEYGSVGAPEPTTFQAHNKGRYIDQEPYRSVNAPVLAFRPNVNGRYVDQRHYKSIGVPEHEVQGLLGRVPLLTSINTM